jgi:hypothetical protein
MDVVQDCLEPSVHVAEANADQEAGPDDWILDAEGFGTRIPGSCLVSPVSISRDVDSKVTRQLLRCCIG